MLTQEQIKNLKPGDNLLLEAFFVEKDGDNIKFTLTPPYVPSPEVFSASPYSLRFLCGADRTFCHTVDNMVKPKHDPTRLFKKGDIVKTVERWGRKVPDAVDIYGYEVPGGPENKEWVVEEAETSGMVEVLCKIGGEFYRHKLPFYHLELVTPVEELEPYSVKETMNLVGWQIVRDGLPLVIYYSQRHPHAKAAAEDECKRLNEEYRKEQNNDRS